jgi:MFS transporter, OFA family, oxalate/formate antiporter
MAIEQSSIRAHPGIALVAATIMTLPLGSIYAFSVLVAPLEDLHQASRSELASVFGISLVFFTIGANLAPLLFGRMRAPLLLALTGVLSAAGVAVAALAPSLGWVILGYGVLFATGGGMAYVAVQQCVNAAPLTKPGLVNGYLVGLFPLGAMLVTPAFGLGIDWVGVRQTLGCLAVVIGSTGLAAAVLIASAGVVLTKAGQSTELNEISSQDHLRATFWKLLTIYFLAATAGLMVLSQAASMVAAFGSGKSAALLATTGITGAIALARLSGGWLVDRLPVPLVAASAQSIALLAAIALTLMPSPEMAIIALGLIGVGYGLISGLMAASVACYWPKAMFGHVVGRTYIAWCLAAISLPVLAGRLYDFTGSYEMAVMVAGAASLFAVLVSLTLPKQKRAR